MLFFSPNKFLQNEKKTKKTYLSHGFIDFSDFSSVFPLDYFFYMQLYIEAYILNVRLHVNHVFF